MVLLSCSLLRGAETNGLQRMEFMVDGVTRRALVYVPAKASVVSTPVVFVFHGHGGSAENALISFAMTKEWPEAISVYMQGLPTPGQLTDPNGFRAGWQAALGDQGNRDVRFFDTVLAQLKQDYNVDKKRVYCTGHSNGGGFTYLLWLARPDVFAAVAPSAAAAKYAHQLIPKPVMIMGGEDDPLVKFEWQKLTMQAVRTVNGCSAKGQPWENKCTIYPSAVGTPVVTFTYPGGHQFNPASPGLIVKFFKEHPGVEK
jgi:polyhydroxybutyrate depolymerase